MVRVNLTGQKFGRITVILFVDQDKKWLCKCKCGSYAKVRADKLKSGQTKSCGCLSVEAKFKHGFTGTRIFRVWDQMITRCYNTKNKKYLYYGGRGIKVCDRWRYSFQLFLKDMGPPPSGHSIDRMDNNKDYAPGNCRWATPKQQANNRRDNVFLTFKGKTQTISQWSEELGVNRGMISQRIQRYGWSVDRTLVI